MSNKYEDCSLYDCDNNCTIHILSAITGNLYRPTDDDLYLYFKKGDKIRVYEDRLICLGKEKNLLCIKQCHQVTYPSILKYNKSKHAFIKENRILFLCEKDVYYYASKIHNY
jgi:hypothetical protein